MYMCAKNNEMSFAISKPLVDEKVGITMAAIVFGRLYNALNMRGFNHRLDFSIDTLLWGLDCLVLLAFGFCLRFFLPMPSYRLKRMKIYSQLECSDWWLFQLDFYKVVSIICLNEQWILADQTAVGLYLSGVSIYDPSVSGS